MFEASAGDVGPWRTLRRGMRQNLEVSEQAALPAFEHLGLDFA